MRLPKSTVFVLSLAHAFALALTLTLVLAPRSRVRSSVRSSRLLIVIDTAFFRSVNIGLGGT